MTTDPRYARDARCSGQPRSRQTGAIATTDDPNRPVAPARPEVGPEAGPDVGEEPVPWTLTLAFWIVVVESAAESLYVLTGDAYGPGGRVLLVLAFAAKAGFAHLARRRSAGGVLGLLTFELVGILVAIGADWSPAVRVGLVATVVAVFVLVLSSLRTFPSPELPS